MGRLNELARQLRDGEDAAAIIEYALVIAVLFTACLTALGTLVSAGTSKLWGLVDALSNN